MSYQAIRPFPPSRYVDSPRRRQISMHRYPRPSSNFEWQLWPEVTIRLSRLPYFTSTLDLFHLFMKEGNISRIDLQDDREGRRTGFALVTFSPPPEKSFWDTPLQWTIQDPSGLEDIEFFVDLEPKKRRFIHQSPVNPDRSYPERTILKADSLRFGMMYEADSMMVMRTIESSTQNPITFVLNLIRRQIEIYFPLVVSEQQQYKIEISLAHMSECWETNDNNSGLGLILPLIHPPKVFRRGLDPSQTHEQGARFWAEHFNWYRQTEVVHNRSSLKTSPITLGQQKVAIDLGRWTIYRLGFNKSQSNPGLYNMIKQALSDYNIPTVSSKSIQLARRDPSYQDWIFPSNPGITDPGSRLWELNGDIIHLPFALRYQLEVCLSHNHINELNIKKEFLVRLASLEEEDALDLLEFVAEKNQRFYNPSDIFLLKAPRGSRSRKIPDYCYLAYTATVTPTSIYFATPMLEASNRVIRQFSQHHARFLRVRFSDEAGYGKVYSQDSNASDAIFSRIKRTLMNGITIGDRHFEFLAFGNSQLREHGAYFFAATSDLTAAGIRSWMGNFREIKIVAKHASRIGQCFSTTRAINGTRVQLKEIADVKRNGYNFTDGVGKISRFLAQMIANELRLQNPLNDPPSVFQFRLGGSKGILTLDLEAKNREIHIRPSQYKFHAQYEGLEIVRCASYATATLNRQTITILSALGIEDEVFLEKQASMLKKLELAMTDEPTAISQLQRYVDPEQMTLEIANIMLNGFMAAKDPFATSILHLWRAWNLKNLKESARIVIEKSAFVLGCIDETNTLRGHWDDAALDYELPFEVRVKNLPEIFLQISNPTRQHDYVTVEGICVLGRNPSLHPGDLRVVRAVKRPQLKYLKNVVVFPQQGDRDIPSMCSGGDLDGDDYFVIWDEELVPPIWNRKPMSHDGLKGVDQSGDITVDHISTFYVNFMKNDRLPTIANAWLANADRQTDGAESPVCYELAALHSVAVDFAKSGVPAKMERRLYASTSPHFMNNVNKPKEKIYRSQKVLGRLFDQVEVSDFNPLYHLPFDQRVLRAYDPTTEFLVAAREIKFEYDAAMRRIMAQLQLTSEFEVWTTFALSQTTIYKKYDFHTLIARHSASLQYQFQQLCYEKAGGSDYAILAPFVVAMYTVTAAEVSEAVQELHKSFHETGEVKVRRMTARERPLMSFPWIFPEILGKIALGAGHVPKESVQLHQKQSTQDTVQTDILEMDLIDLHSGSDEVVNDRGIIIHRGDILELFQGEGKDDSMVDAVQSAHHQLRSTMETAEEIVRLSSESDSQHIDTPMLDSGESSHVSDDEEMEEGEIVELEMEDEPSALEKLAKLLET